MTRTLSSMTELVVGLACLLGAVVAWPRRLRWIAAVLAVAGAAAIAHAVTWLA